MILINPHSEKFLKGLGLAIEKLVEKKKKENGQLVISQNGKVVRVNARDLK